MPSSVPWLSQPNVTVRSQRRSSSPIESNVTIGGEGPQLELTAPMIRTPRTPGPLLSGVTEISKVHTRAKSAPITDQARAEHSTSPSGGCSVVVRPARCRSQPRSEVVAVAVVASATAAATAQLGVNCRPFGKQIESSICSSPVRVGHQLTSASNSPAGIRSIRGPHGGEEPAAACSASACFPSKVVLPSTITGQATPPRQSPLRYGSGPAGLCSSLQASSIAHHARTQTAPTVTSLDGSIRVTGGLISTTGLTSCSMSGASTPRGTNSYRRVDPEEYKSSANRMVTKEVQNRTSITGGRWFPAG